MLNIGKVGRSITLAGSLFLSSLGCGGESRAAKLAAIKADDVLLSQAANKLIDSCKANTKGLDSFSKCVDAGVKPNYPASCTYFITRPFRYSKELMYPSECEERFRLIIGGVKGQIIYEAKRPPEEVADIARFERAAAETYKSCDKGHLKTPDGRDAFKHCVVNNYQRNFPGCAYMPNQIFGCDTLFSREVIAGVEPYIQNAL